MLYDDKKMIIFESVKEDERFWIETQRLWEERNKSR